MIYKERVNANINIVDLKKIDLLVEKGLYENRTEFIKDAIKNQIQEQEYIIRETVVEEAHNVGIVSYSKDHLEELKKANKKIDIKSVGMCILNSDIDSELALQVINSIEVRGLFRAKPELKDKLKEIIVE